MKRLLRSRWFALVACAGLVAGCVTVPETGRLAFNIVPADQERAMGASAFSEIKTKERISQDPEKTATVRRVGERLSRAIGSAMPDAQWEFVLFDNDAVNAFALPGGKVGVYTGIFDVARNDDELAVVMGHEIAHVIAHHGAERMSQEVGVSAVGMVLDAALAGQDEGKRRLAMTAYGLGSTLGVALPFSRLQEGEADEIGLIYAARAGYDPRAALRFWTGMQEATRDKARPPEWLSTHPSDETRIKRIQKMMPRMLEIYEKSNKQ